MKIKILSAAVLLTAAFFASCSSKKRSTDSEITDIQQISFVKQSHKWFAFSRTDFGEVELPQEGSQALEAPWTEAIRISQAASVPASQKGDSPIQAYALVNHLGMLSFSQNEIKLYTDTTALPYLTADSMVFSDGKPVFYLYRSSFFNEESLKADSRPFLLEFNPGTGVFYPLVSYENLKLNDDEEIVGYFWNGGTWTCAAKRILDRQVEFKYFVWQPLVDLTALSPALTSDNYIFTAATEEDYRSINMPRLFSAAPEQLKTLVSSIPSEFTFYVSWRDGSGTSPVSYYQAGKNAVSVNAKGISDKNSSLDVIVFADGTTYLRDNKAGSNGSGETYAFRLPLLPAGYTYGEVAIAGNRMYVAWEETNFFKTGRAGFIQVELEEVITSIKEAIASKQ